MKTKRLGKQIISHVELIAALSVRMILAKELAGRRVIIWLDNEAARFGLIKGRSPSPSMDSLLRLFASVEDSSPSFTWICRVPSHSKLADGPSREDPQLALALTRARCMEPLMVPPEVEKLFS